MQVTVANATPHDLQQFRYNNMLVFLAPAFPGPAVWGRRDRTSGQGLFGQIPCETKLTVHPNLANTAWQYRDE